MTYKYHLRSGSESKAKNEIDNKIIDLNQRIVTIRCPYFTPFWQGGGGNWFSPV